MSSKPKEEKKVRINFLLNEGERDEFKRACMRNEKVMTEVLFDYVKQYTRKNKRS